MVCSSACSTNIKRDAAKKHIFEYVPNEYSVSDENLQKAAAVEIKMGQSVKPGMGGHLPAAKVTAEIAKISVFWLAAKSKAQYTIHCAPENLN